jgi:uptake hydrogenase large subunit
MNAPAEGIIRIALSAQTGQGSARIENVRPLRLTNRFARRKPAEVAAAVPLVFSICRAAQTAACAEAIENATGAMPSPHTKVIRELTVLGETAREHALQVLHIWPRCVRTPESTMAAASVKRLLTLDRELAGALKDAKAVDAVKLDHVISELKAILAEAIFGETLEDWALRRDAAELGYWARRNETLAQTLFEYLIQTGMADAGAAEVSPLPQMNASALQAVLLSNRSDAFIEQPEWGGRPCETTPLGRQARDPLILSVKERYGPGLLARLAAVLAELAKLPGKMRGLADILAGLSREERGPQRVNGTGLGFAEAARGRLVHAIDIQRGVVHRYRILAPTEWNFHPAGAVAKGLASIAIAAPARREMLARLFITAASPCVGYELSLPDA